MYNTAKTLHLFFGVVITPFLLFYAISAVFIAHGFIDLSSSHIEQNSIVLERVPKQQSELLDVLRSEYGIDGKLSSASRSDGIWKLRIFHPGIHYKISIRPDGRAEVEKRIFNGVGFLKELHITSGLHGESSEYFWWATAVQVTGISLLGLLLSGLVMWFFRSMDRRGGLWFLSASTLYCIVVICVLRLG